MVEGQTVLVVGLGRMGGAIARRLRSVGRPVLGYDIDPAVRLAAEEWGVRAVSDLRGAVSEATTVLTSLPNPEVVREVFLSATGICAAIRPGALVVELSTIDPFTMREVAARLEQDGEDVAVVDAPVSGGVEEAGEGKLSLMVGADHEALRRAGPLLEDLGTVRGAGAVGDAKVIKLINNLAAISNVLVGVEALALARGAGVDPGVLYSILSNSGASSYQLNKRMPRAIESDFAPRFSLELAEKDLRLALELAHRLGVMLPASQAAWQRFSTAKDSGHGAEDMLAIARLYDTSASSE